MERGVYSEEVGSDGDQRGTEVRAIGQSRVRV